MVSGAAVETYDWTLFDAGSRLGSLRSPAACAPFYVSDGLVAFGTPPRVILQGESLVEEPLMLRAVSLANGVEQWSHEIRDTEYRGPFPP